jgi:hypothetical protein
VDSILPGTQLSSYRIRAPGLLTSWILNGLIRNKVARSVADMGSILLSGYCSQKYNKQDK